MHIEHPRCIYDTQDAKAIILVVIFVGFLSRQQNKTTKAHTGQGDVR